MASIESVTAISVNFKTPDLVWDCITSFAVCYPNTHHIVIDNGGCRDSLVMLRGLKDASERITLVENPRNLGHGLALNQGLALATTDFVFLLDSDTRTEKCGFLEKMLDEFESNPLLFAIGWHRWVADSGVPFQKQDDKPEGAVPYIHPHACLLDARKFKILEPFRHSGAPAIRLMISAEATGFEVKDFPVEDYIWHKIAGTRGMFGGNISPRTEQEPNPWSWRPI